MEEVAGSEGQVLADRYRLIALLGRGGMGCVWRAEHVSLGTPVAVKLIYPALAARPGTMGRFLREAKAAALLRSINVVQILDYGVHEETPYIAMECLEGESLADRLAREGKLDPAATALVLTGVCRALTRAHRMGIVHRDLKPDNIFIARDEAGPIVKVLDFGIAKMIDPEVIDSNAKTATANRTEAGVMLGTPRYMSPEQARGHMTVDGRSDLWSLSVIAFECVTGQVPFDADILGALIMQICSDPVLVPSSIADVPPGFDAWFARAMKRDPADRFQTVRELADALGEVLTPGQRWLETSSDGEPPARVTPVQTRDDDVTQTIAPSVKGEGDRWAPFPLAPPAPRAPALQQAHPAPKPAPAGGARFFGRQVELRAVIDAFDSGARLVTLVGPGGAGKTRCALEVCAARVHVFCDLASATTEAGVVSAVAAALEVPLDGADTMDWARGVGRALSALPDRLVVLDNAEQAIDVISALVTSWLSGRPTLLVTSREPLRIKAERVVSIGPLPQAAAEALFVDRVMEAGGDPGDSELLARIVERVDRLPLAIELAAAQVPQLGAKALLDSLDAQLATLVSGPRDAPPRHATMRATVAWSWTFLGEREREVLRLLSVLSGSFTIAAARAIASGDDVVAVIAALCRRCQIRRERDRFALYAAVRELAREHGGDRSGVEARHAAHFVRVGEEAVTLLSGPRHAEGSSTLVAEIGELRAAWTWARGRDAVLAARLALVLDRAFGLQAEKASARRDLLAESRQGLDRPDLVCALLLAEGRVEGAPIALLDQACALAGEPRIEAEIRLARGERLAAIDLAAARAELDRALDLATEAGAAALRGCVLAAIGEVLWAHGLAAEANARLHAALAVHEEVGDRRAIARTAALLAHVDRLDTGGGAARDLLRRAEAAAADLGEPVVLARVLMDLGQHLTRTGDQAGARAALDEAGELYDRVGFARERAFLHLHVAETLLGVGDFDEALNEAHRALASLQNTGAVGRSTTYEAIGCVHLLRGDLAQAERWIEDGLGVARQTGAVRSECTLLGKRGLLHLARGAPDRAFGDFDSAVQKNQARGSVTISAASLADRAMAGFALGDDDRAAADLSRAREMLHDPPETQWDGRMLVVCEVVGRAFGAVRAGIPREEAHAHAREKTARFFARVPPHEWDVVHRFLDWIVDRIGALPA